MFGIEVPRYEKIWLWFGIITLGIFLVVTGYMAVTMELHPANGHEKTVAPEKVLSTAPFDKPGVYPSGQNRYDVVMVARAFQFLPATPTIPVGATVHFRVTSPDVVHGIAIPGTNVNMMILPGHVTEFTYAFKKAGEYLMICNEYCGVGHQLMMAKITVR